MGASRRLERADGEPLIHKTSHNAFTTTNLQQLLTERGITDLTVCGIRTEQCCETTLVARLITSVYVLAALKRYLVTLILVGVTLIILAYGTLSVIFNSSRFQLWLERELSIRAGYEITFGDIKFGLPFKITGAALTIAMMTFLLIWMSLYLRAAARETKAARA